MEKNTLKSLLKIANKLDTLGLTSEADLLDGIICKIAANIINPKTNQKVNMDDELSRFLDSYISGGSLRVPEYFSEWLLSEGTGKKSAGTFFNPMINPIWKDYGFKYIQTLPRNGSSIDFYLKLAQLVSGWNEDKADVEDQSDIRIIYKNLYGYKMNSNSPMRSSNKHTTGESIAYAVGDVVASPYTAYKALQNPAVRRETKQVLDTYSNFEVNGSLSQNVISIVFGAPLSFANALVDFQTGNWKSGVLNFVDAIVSTLFQAFGGKLLIKLFKDPVKTALISTLFGVALSRIVSEAKTQIINSNKTEKEKSDAVSAVKEEEIRPVIESRFKEQVLKLPAT